MLPAYASGRKKLSSAGIGARSQAGVRWRSRAEHGRNGRVQSRQQLEQQIAIAVRYRNHAAAAAWSYSARRQVSRTSLSRLDHYERWAARAGVQLPVWRSGDAGAFTPDEIRLVAAVGSDHRRQNRAMCDRLGHAPCGHGCAGLWWVSWQI